MMQIKKNKLKIIINIMGNNKKFMKMKKLKIKIRKIKKKKKKII